MPNMNEQLPPFLRRKGDSILYNGNGNLYFYIPEKYFERNIAYYNGEYISTLGVMSYAMKENGKMSTLKQFNYPTRILTKPFKVEKMKFIKLIKESEPLDYRVLCYKKDDAILVETKVPQSVDNTEDMISLFIINGFIPNTIPYDQIQNYIVDNCTYNGAKYKISLQLFGIIISELCRSKKDINVPFRLSKDNDMNNYKSISIKVIPRLISAYSAITSENINEALIYASLNDNKVQSPLERIVTGEDV